MKRKLYFKTLTFTKKKLLKDSGTRFFFYFQAFIINYRKFSF